MGFSGIFMELSPNSLDTPAAFLNSSVRALTEFLKNSYGTLRKLLEISQPISGEENENTLFK